MGAQLLPRAPEPRSWRNHQLLPVSLPGKAPSPVGDQGCKYPTPASREKPDLKFGTKFPGPGRVTPARVVLGAAAVREEKRPHCSSSSVVSETHTPRDPDYQLPFPILWPSTLLHSNICKHMRTDTHTYMHTRLNTLDSRHSVLTHMIIHLYIQSTCTYMQSTVCTLTHTNTHTDDDPVKHTDAHTCTFMSCTRTHTDAHAFTKCKS